MLNKKFSLIFILIIFGPGCGGRKKIVPQIQKQRSTIDQKEHIAFHIRIEGVECQFCAQSAQEQLATLEGVKQARYVLVDDDFEKGYCLLVWTKPQQALTKGLMNSVLFPEGFQVISCERA